MAKGDLVPRVLVLTPWELDMLRAAMNHVTSLPPTKGGIRFASEVWVRELKEKMRVCEEKARGDG